MAVRPSTTEWMMHPSLIFKSFEDPMKPPFTSYSGSPQFVPEKILETVVDQNGIRCYRVKWLDSWVPEHHINATFPHLITEYWINKPINDTDYQNYASQIQNQQRAAPVALSQQPPSATRANETVASSGENSQKLTTVSRTLPLTVTAGTTELLQQLAGPQSAPSASVPQLFTNDTVVAPQKTTTTSEATTSMVNSNMNNSVVVPGIHMKDFIVEGLRLPDRVPTVALSKAQETFTLNRPIGPIDVNHSQIIQQLQQVSGQQQNQTKLLPILPKGMENAVQYLMTKALYNFPNLEEKVKTKDQGKTIQLSAQSSVQLSAQPSTQPSGQPSAQHLGQPSAQHLGQPSTQPSGQPSAQVSDQSSAQASDQRCGQPSDQSCVQLSNQPSDQNAQPPSQLSNQPSVQLSGQVSSQSSTQPSIQPPAHITTESVFNNTFNHMHQLDNQQTIALPSIEQLNQAHQAQHLLLLAQSIEKVTASPKKPNASVKSASQPKEKKPVECDICGKMISSKKNLRVHKTVRHFKNGSFPCHICGRKFALNRDLERHMPLHTNERKYTCPYCGLLCKQPGHLTKHMRTHTEVMNWRCDCCFKNFKVQADLKEHCFKDHADIKEKNLNCAVCKELLKLPNSVYLHSLRHSGVREFSCEICKATFKLKQHMQVHMRTHEKPKDSEKVVCHICEKPFKTKAIFEKHLEKHTATTAEEYKENKLKEAEEKKKRKSRGAAKRRLKSSAVWTDDDDVDENDGGDEGADDIAQKILIGKRKQRTPSKILYDEDLNTKCVVRKKFERKKHSCCECNDTFRSYVLLRSHMKLHAQQREQEKQQQADVDLNHVESESQIVEKEEMNNEDILYVAVQRDVKINDNNDENNTDNGVVETGVASTQTPECNTNDSYDERMSKDLLQLADISVSLAAAATSDVPTSCASDQKTT